jgi:hypothetical protein
METQGQTQHNIVLEGTAYNLKYLSFATDHCMFLQDMDTLYHILYSQDSSVQQGRQGKDQLYFLGSSSQLNMENTALAQSQDYVNQIHKE